MNTDKPVEQDLDSFIRTFRSQRAQSRMSNPPSDALVSSSTNASADNVKSIRPLPTFSEHDIQKMKYKIDLDKQVAEKKNRDVLEWETKLQRDKKYAKQQALFGSHEHPTPIRKQELEQILTQSKVPSPTLLKKPEILTIHYQQLNAPNEKYSSSSSREPAYGNQSFNSINSAKTTKPSSPPDDFLPSSSSDYQRFYGGSANTNRSSSYLTPLSKTAQPLKGDAHDPFILFDPNKEPQQVFNIIPQQNLYEPWGRPGAGAPLIHQQTGQKFTRYAGSLEDKLNTVGPLSLYRDQYHGNILDQKHDMEVQKTRREQEKRERRLNPGETAADWISQLEGSHYPLKFHKPTTKTTRHFTGTHDPYSAEDANLFRSELSRQTEERARLEQIARYENNLADLQHTEVQNSWWGREAVGVAKPKKRPDNVQNALNSSQSYWTSNSLGPRTTTDSKPSVPMRFYDAHFAYPKSKFISKHTNFYQLSDPNNT
ncbi:unnamed protein product [Adineta ricciae]|uniref:Uncharacterized protein n=1 Tax=Adineta ricciae TaxID=249248 RepID=A0A815D618_ADIRI|nr:unnamed protein product [Adineta ricciae]